MWEIREINLTFDANIDQLRELHRSHFTKTKPYMSYSDAISLFTNRLKSFVTFKDATMCYGMCKMTVERDFFTAEGGYKKLEFVEFLEYIARIANEKYKTDIPLYEKVEKVLDNVLALIDADRKEMRRKILVKQQFQWSESEEEVESDREVNQSSG